MAVCNHWTGLVDWTTGLDWSTGLTFDLKISHKNGSIVKAECVLGLTGDEGQSWSVHVCTLVKTDLNDFKA